MVYDEGFDITIGNLAFFAFSMYSVNLEEKKLDNKINSHCYATLNGWYHNGDKYGCFYAVKNKVDDPFKVTMNETNDKKKLVEGFVSNYQKRVFIFLIFLQLKENTDR